MAHLSDERGDRAQILLIAGLVLGITFVSLALVLNSAIFTENLASRGETTGADNVVEFRDDLRRGIGTLLTYENRNVSDSESRGDVLNRVTVGVGDVNGILTRRHAKGGAISDVSVGSHTAGSRINQSDYSRNFTDGNYEENWTVAENVDRTRAFRLDVSRSALESCGSPDDCFNITVSNASATWEMSVSGTGSGVEVGVDNGSGTTTTCDSVDKSTVEIDLTAGTVAGKNCPALSFADVPSSGYDIEFGNGDNAEGTYSFVVGDETIADSPPAHFDAGSGPSVRPALYDVTLAYEYETADVAVDGELRVAPGEPDG